MDSSCTHRMGRANHSRIVAKTYHSVHHYILMTVQDLCLKKTICIRTIGFDFIDGHLCEV